jgi:hypothetical protein
VKERSVRTERADWGFEQGKTLRSFISAGVPADAAPYRGHGLEARAAEQP